MTVIAVTWALFILATGADHASAVVQPYPSYAACDKGRAKQLGPGEFGVCVPQKKDGA